MNPRDEGTRAAERIRSDYWGDTIPVDPVRIAKALGIRVVEAFLDPDVSGAIERKAGKETNIYLNVSDSSTRKRFTCAHEIGHFEKHAAESDDFEYIDYRDPMASTGQVADERYANAFAAALLMPEDRIRQLRELGLNDGDMARRFGVSKEAMVNRLKNLGIYR